MFQSQALKLTTPTLLQDIEVHGLYSNRLEHTNFIVCESDTFEQLDAAFDPILEMGNFEVTPLVKRG